MPVVPIPVEPTAEWLQPAGYDVFFRPSDYFICQVVRARLARWDTEHHRSQLEAAWKFRQVHGREALIDALRSAERMTEGLHGPLADLLDKLTEDVAV